MHHERMLEPTHDEWRESTKETVEKGDPRSVPTEPSVNS
jgi:hypothetical protein